MEGFSRDILYHVPVSMPVPASDRWRLISNEFSVNNENCSPSRFYEGDVVIEDRSIPSMTELLRCYLGTKRPYFLEKLRSTAPGILLPREPCFTIADQVDDDNPLRRYREGIATCCIPRTEAEVC